MKTAVILLGLGAPDTVASVRPFICNQFNDRAALNYPAILRAPLAWLLSHWRAARARRVFLEEGGGKPLAAAAAEARALQLALGHGYSCFVAMRYWKPYVADCVAAVAASKPHRIILLPVDPHFSGATLASTVATWRAAAKQAGLDLPTVTFAGNGHSIDELTRLVRRASLTMSPTTPTTAA